MLSNLAKAIQELEIQKQQLLEKIQKSTWKDDLKKKRIPGRTVTTSTDFTFGFETETEFYPEKRLLPSDVRMIYQKWYSASRSIIAKNQPNRLHEFDELYFPSGKNAVPGIKRFLENRYVTKDEQFRMIEFINAQFEILSAVPVHLQYSIYDIELTTYSILMDDEIEAARYLLSKGFYRSAGALAGVTLERHLKNLLRKHTPPIKYKEKDMLATLNDLCKEIVYDLITWRKIQHLTDLRNLCDHDKHREPTKAEVEELVDGVSAIIKTQNN